MENKTIPISFNWWHAIINYRTTKAHTIIIECTKPKGKDIMPENLIKVKS